MSLTERRLMLRGSLATESLGGALARACAGEPAHIHLEGELGTGKTTLVRGFLRALGLEGAVKSPTYTLVEPYLLRGVRVYHLDLYRLGDPEELEFLGLRDYLEDGGVLLVEWPQRGAGVLPAADLTVHLDHAGAELRRVALSALSPRGERILARLPPFLEAG